MRKLLLKPNTSGYSVTIGNEIVSVQVSGGASRSRRDYVGLPSTVNVSWMLDEAGFDYLNAFFRTITQNGVLPFLCDLLLDRPALVEYTCKFIPNSFKPVASTTGASIFNATAQLEVLPKITDELLDLEIIETYEAYNNFDPIAALALIVNITMPDNLQ